MPFLCYLEKWNDERTQGEVGGFLQLGVKFLYRQVGILHKNKQTIKHNDQDVAANEWVLGAGVGWRGGGRGKEQLSNVPQILQR